MTYQVTLKPSGNSFNTQPEEHILDGALREGISLPYGCRNGTCRSCCAEILSGTVDYPHGKPAAIATGSNTGGNWCLLCQAIPTSDVVVKIQELPIGAFGTIRTVPCRVTKRSLAAEDVMILNLRLPKGEVFNYEPGQYLDIVLRDGRRRSFSIANAPDSSNELTLHIRRVPDGQFSNYVFAHLKDKALLRIRGPLGSFYLRESQRPLLFVAGGTGLAPIKAIIESCIEQNRFMYLYWGVRAVKDLYLTKIIKQWCASNPDFHYIPVLSQPDGAPWAGKIGLIHNAVLDDFEDLSKFDVYSSGPPVMIDAAWRTFETRGLKPEHHFSDAFEFAHETGADEII